MLIIPLPGRSETWTRGSSTFPFGQTGGRRLCNSRDVFRCSCSRIDTVQIGVRRVPTATTIVVAREDFSIPGGDPTPELDPTIVETGHENRFFSLLHNSKPDVVVLDLTNANGKGVGTILRIRRKSSRADPRRMRGKCAECARLSHRRRGRVHRGAGRRADTQPGAAADRPGDEGAGDGDAARGARGRARSPLPVCASGRSRTSFSATAASVSA